MLCPTLSGYATFLFSVAGIDASALPPFSGTGTLQDGVAALTIATVAVNWLTEGAIVTDAQSAIPAGTTIGCYLSGTTPGGIGEYQISQPATDSVSTPEMIAATNPWIVETLKAALAEVNEALRVSGMRYTEAVYNLAADLLINLATDQPNQTYFRDLRKGYRITAPSFGLPASASDQGTSGALVNPEFMQHLTLDNLQRAKTPYGRVYLGIAQDYGSVIWGLS